MIALILALSLAFQPQYPAGHLLMEPEELVRPDVASQFVILDVRSSQAYAAGHVPGAVRVDASEWAAHFQDGTDAKAWSERLGLLGLTTRSRVVVYDDASNNQAARIWWILRYWNVQDVRLLHGMWHGWKTGEFPVSTEAAEPKKTVFEAAGNADRLATREELLAVVKEKSAHIVDARTSAEHTGLAKLSNRHGGCIPGSTNLDWVQLIDSKTQRFKSAEQLRELFDTHHIDLGKPQVVHCQSGGRSSVMQFAMELMGAKAVKNYHASWKEWGNSDETPIEKKAK